MSYCRKILIYGVSSLQQIVSNGFCCPYAKLNNRSSSYIWGTKPNSFVEDFAKNLFNFRSKNVTSKFLTFDIRLQHTSTDVQLVGVISVVVGWASFLQFFLVMQSIS